jgi:Tol biopolymer transport system component
MWHRLFGLAVFGALASVARAEGTVRLSVDRSRVDGNGASLDPAMTPDARFVAFASDASDLVRNDTNGVTDVFVRDRLRGSTERISVDSAEHEAHGASYDPAISADGRFVVFTSDAEDLVPGDTNHWSDVFLRDRLRGLTVRVSVSSSGGQGSEGSFSPAISGDGQLVAFVSQAPDLVSGDGNFSWDVFVRDLAAGTTERVSVDPSGLDADSGSFDPCLSFDGNLVVFASLASNLVAGDTNAYSDIFLRDRALGTTQRLTRGLGGGQTNQNSSRPCISDDGQVVAFESRAGNIVLGDLNFCTDVFVLTRTTGQFVRVSVDSTGFEAKSACGSPSLAASGRWVAFCSAASNLVPDDTNGVDDVFVHDMETRMTLRASVAAGGGESNDASGEPSVSSNGDNVAFSSFANNLVPKDHNQQQDVFSRERCTKEASATAYGTGWPGTLGEPQILTSNDPELNNFFKFTFTNSWGQPAPTLWVIGPSKASIPTNRDGTLLVEPVVLQLICIPPQGLTFNCLIPPDESACGMEADMQILELDPGASKGVSFSKGLEVILGF